MNKKSGYAIESRHGVEYVIVRCPQGHRLRGMKVSGDLKVQQEVACCVGGCRMVWTQLLPMNNGFEADE